MFTTILIAGFVPLAVAAITALVLLRGNAAPRVIWPVAIAVGFLTGQLAIKSEAGLGTALYRFVQPQEAVDWLPLIVLLALGVTAVTNHASIVGRFRTTALAAAFTLAVPVRLLSGNVRLTHHWSVFEKLVYLSLLAATLGVVWLLLATENKEEPLLLRAGLLTLVAVGTAIVTTLSGAFVAGLSCGAVAASIAGTALACTLLPIRFGSGATGAASGAASAQQRRSSAGIPAAAPVITFSLGSLILLGHFYAYVTITHAALLFLSLAATSVPLPNFLGRAPIWQQAAARTLVCVLPLLIAVIGVLSE
jgi:hypothetical protein